LNPDTVAHLSTNRARRRLTSLIEANALTTTPDRQPKVVVRKGMYFCCTGRLMSCCTVHSVACKVVCWLTPIRDCRGGWLISDLYITLRRWKLDRVMCRLFDEMDALTRAQVDDLIHCYLQ